MDDRQTQIREGAGLEESRLNVEFIDWLRKWSTPLLLLGAAIALGYVGLGRLEKMRIAKTNRAFSEYTATALVRDPSPDALARFAQEYEGVGSVGSMARLRAADTYLERLRTGLMPGAQVNAGGLVEDEAGLLTENDRAQAISRARDLYTEVYDQTRGEPGKRLFAIAAAYGLASVEECQGDLDAAKRWYEQVVDLADREGLGGHKKIAQERIDTLATLGNPVHFFKRTELPALPSAAPPQLEVGNAPDVIGPMPPPAPDKGAEDPAPESQEPGPAADGDSGALAPPGEPADEQTDDPVDPQ